jgi:hypothetical protein
MKKFGQLLLFMGIAVGIILALHFLTTPGGGRKSTTGSGNKLVQEFEAQCDAMALGGKWNKARYNELKEQLETYSSKTLISGTDAMSCENWLEVAYAKSLLAEYNTWLSGGGTTGVQALYDEMRKQDDIDECRLIIGSCVPVIGDYLTAKGIPSSVSKFLSGPFNASKYNDLLAKIERCCNRSEISHFSELQQIDADQTARLNNFMTFDDKYSKRKNFWLADQTQNFFYYNLLCPENDPEINQYAYYLNDIRTQGICTP